MVLASSALDEDSFMQRRRGGKKKWWCCVVVTGSHYCVGVPIVWERNALHPSSLPPPLPSPPPSSPEELRTSLQRRGRGFQGLAVGPKRLVLPIAPCPPRHSDGIFLEILSDLRLNNHVTLCRRRPSPSTSMGADGVLVILVQNNVDVLHTLFPPLQKKSG